MQCVFLYISILENIVEANSLFAFEVDLKTESEERVYANEESNNDGCYNRYEPERGEFSREKVNFCTAAVNGFDGLIKFRCFCVFPAV